MADSVSWWQDAVVYQVYPRSFYDTDGDGLGDLQGVTEKLDYIADLGVDAVWITPVYDSPQEDNGYDVRDYRTIDEAFGTFEDWQRLRDGIHDRGMRLIMDFVLNHTSDQHEWFRKSRRQDPDYEDYYIWRSGDGGPPNNWESFFGGPAWEFDELRGEYYLHLYDDSQPDLNWANESVREDVFDIVDWWLDRGVDGLRLDVINVISKPQHLPDGDPSNSWIGSEHFLDGPRIHEYLSALRRSVLDEYDVLAIGETPRITVDKAEEYVGDDGPLDMVFQFDHMKLDYGSRGRWSVGDWDLSELRSITRRWQTELDDRWNALFWENHDQPRSVSRFGDDETYRYESATMLATYLLTLRGTPFLYQGQEIGMTNGEFESLGDFRDVDAINHARELMAAADSEYDGVRDVVEYRSRDNARTPMQWTDEPNAGFTDGEPWIPVNQNYDRINVAAARQEDGSILDYYRDLITLRSEMPVLVRGDYADVRPDHDAVYTYCRQIDDGADRALVALNVTADRQSSDLPDTIGVESAAPLIGNYGDPPSDPSELTLRPYEAVVYDLS